MNLTEILLIYLSVLATAGVLMKFRQMRKEGKI